MSTAVFPRPLAGDPQLALRFVRGLERDEPRVEVRVSGEVPLGIGPKALDDGEVVAVVKPASVAEERPVMGGIDHAKLALEIRDDLVRARAGEKALPVQDLVADGVDQAPHEPVLEAAHQDFRMIVIVKEADGVSEGRAVFVREHADDVAAALGDIAEHSSFGVVFRLGKIVFHGSERGAFQACSLRALLPSFRDESSGSRALV